jgi:hypothetical protein
LAYLIRARGGDGMSDIRQGARDVEEALLKARHMVLAGLARVAIEDEHGNTITGDELAACCQGRMVLSKDLKAAKRR